MRESWNLWQVFSGSTKNMIKTFLDLSFLDLSFFETFSKYLWSLLHLARRNFWCLVIFWDMLSKVVRNSLILKMIASTHLNRLLTPDSNSFSTGKSHWNLKKSVKSERLSLRRKKNQIAFIAPSQCDRLLNRSLLISSKVLCSQNAEMKDVQSTAD